MNLTSEEKQAQNQKNLKVGCVVSFCIIILCICAIVIIFTFTGEEKSPQIGKQRTYIADVKTYLSLLRSSGITDALVIDVAPGRVDGEIKITVANGWHFQPYQLRLQGAQNLWKIWANLHAPTKPDSAHIRLVDLNGNDVGGSRALAGSLIWVQKE
jgi:hypothetical protein